MMVRINVRNVNNFLSSGRQEGGLLRPLLHLAIQFFTTGAAGRRRASQGVLAREAQRPESEAIRMSPTKWLTHVFSHWHIVP